MLQVLEVVSTNHTHMCKIKVALRKFYDRVKMINNIDTYENVEKYESFKLFLNESGFDIIGEELPWVDMGNILLKNRNVIS